MFQNVGSPRPKARIRLLKQRGFTIVELLIVIVVIAILAAIVIVAYTGIQNKAHAAAAQSAASDVTKLLSIYNTNNGIYPADLTTVNNGQPMPTSGGTSYVYHPGAGNTSYCTTVTNANSSYRVTDTATTPVTGGCPGDGVGGVAAITNLIANPSFETGTSGWQQGPNATIAQWGGQVYTGTSSAIVTHTSGAVAGNAFVTFPVSGLTIGAQYTVSFWTRATGTGNPSYWATVQDTNIGGATPAGMTTFNVTPTGTWTKYTLTWTADKPNVYFLLDSIGTGAGESYALDGVIFTQGSTVYNYADGNSPNWIWNGTANNSTSTGPPQ